MFNKIIMAKLSLTYGKMCAKVFKDIKIQIICAEQKRKVNKMKYLKQFGVILVFSFIGEILNQILPLPVPASIYGIVLLFTALMCGAVKLEQVEKTGDFLIEIMPLMFIPAAVGLLESWGIVKDSLGAFVVTTLISTVIVMGVSGVITQIVIKRQKNKKGVKEK